MRNLYSNLIAAAALLLLLLLSFGTITAQVPQGDTSSVSRPQTEITDTTASAKTPTQPGDTTASAKPAPSFSEVKKWANENEGFIGSSA